MKKQQNTKCMICHYDLWIKSTSQLQFIADKLSTDSNLNHILEPIHEFNSLLSTFDSSCLSCATLPIICIMGRTGSGKSTLLNIIAGCKPTIQKSTTGSKELYFPTGICEVGGGHSSLTMFCNILQTKEAIYIDFAGFFDNRPGQLQLLQHLLLHYITSERMYKIVAVKDIRTSRDLAFLEFLNLEWVCRQNTLVVMTHTTSENGIDWKVYGEGLVSKEFKVLMMPLGLKGFSLSQFQSKLKGKIGKLVFSSGIIEMDISPPVYQFISESIGLLRSSIDKELFGLIKSGIVNVVVEPYDVEHFLNVFKNKHSLNNSISILMEIGIISKLTPSLEILKQHWTVLATLSKDPSFADRQNFSQWTPSSHHLLLKFLKKLDEFTPPEYPLIDTGDLASDLKKWQKLCHAHYLEHVSFKSRVLHLVNIGDLKSFKELERLSLYRQQTFEKMVIVWKVLEERFLLEIENSNVLSTSGQFFEQMDMKDVKNVLLELVRFASTNADDLSALTKFLATNLTGIAMADGIIGAATWLIEVVKSGSIGGLPKMGFTLSATGAMVAALATAAVGAFTYHLLKTKQKLQKLRAIGFDFSFLRVESCIWIDILHASQIQDGFGVKRALATFEKEFRLFINSTRQGVLHAKQKLLNSKSSGVSDTHRWEKLIDNVDLMSRSIFTEMKARQRSARGCHFHEHEWQSRGLLAVNFDVLSCCKFYLKKMPLECMHCGFLCHKDQECKLLALQITCKSVLRDQENNDRILGKSSSVTSIQKWNRDAEREALLFSKNQEIVNCVYYAKCVQDSGILGDDEMIVDEVDSIKYLITVNEGTAYVVVRGTVMSNLLNWLTNFNALMIPIDANVPGSVHAGFYTACNLIYGKIWKSLRKLTVNRVVFGGHSLGGAIAHCLHLKSFLDRENAHEESFVSYAFGSPLLFDKNVEQLILNNGGDLQNFVTFVNESDPVPSIIQAIGKGLLQPILKNLGISNGTTSFISIATKEMTRHYQSVGKYVFFDQKAFWKDSTYEKVMKRLDHDVNLYRVDTHEIGEYYKGVNVFLDMESLGIFDQRES